jgi:hypothetical protein
VRSGNEKVSHYRRLARAAAFVITAALFVALLQRAKLSALEVAPRDQLVVAPATEDSPAMMMWVAAELDPAPRPSRAVAQTLGYRLPRDQTSN